MGTGTAFSIANWLTLFLLCYWSLKTVLALFTYLKPRRITLLLLSIAIPIISIKLGFILGFLTILGYLLAKRLKVGSALSASILAFILFFIGAISVTIIFGIAGTALKVPGYQMNGTLRELVERVYG
ncbi:hypothetical protein [Thermococcus sp.]|uniref:hypothetical protein n=1 Tax=Thermococcus sp. TaxID=35749 RepID=UPI002616DB0C|nr:hypothetical protein [Thermococcus sp.]